MMTAVQVALLDSPPDPPGHYPMMSTEKFEKAENIVPSLSDSTRGASPDHVAVIIYKNCICILRSFCSEDAVVQSHGKKVRTATLRKIVCSDFPRIHFTCGNVTASCVSNLPMNSARNVCLQCPESCIRTLLIAFQG